MYLPVLKEETADLAAPFIPEPNKRGTAYVDLGLDFRERAAAGETLFVEVDGETAPKRYSRGPLVTISAKIPQEVLNRLRDLLLSVPCLSYLPQLVGLLLLKAAALGGHRMADHQFEARPDDFLFQRGVCRQPLMA